MVYKWYILPIGGLYGTYHLLREPVGNSIDPSSLLFSVGVLLQKLTAKNLRFSPLFEREKIIGTKPPSWGFHVTFWGCRFFDFRWEVTAVLVCLTKAASESGF